MSRTTIPITLARVGGFFALLVAILPFGLALRMYSVSSTLVSEGRQALGVVVAVEQPRTMQDGEPVAVIEFLDAGGQPHEFRTTMGLQRGDAVDVIYPPDEPELARINSFRTLWLGPTIAGVMTFPPIIFGLFLIFLAPGLIRRADARLADSHPADIHSAANDPAGD